MKCTWKSKNDVFHSSITCLYYIIDANLHLNNYMYIVERALKIIII